MKMPQRIPGKKPIDIAESKIGKAAVLAASGAEADIAAQFLVEIMGEDVAAAFFTRFGRVMEDACRRAEDLAHIRRAEDAPEIALPASQVRRREVLQGSVLPNEQLRIQATAARIERGEDIAPIIVRIRSKACCSCQPYDLVSGWDEFSALVDVLGRTTVPVQIAPPVPPETLSMFDNSDA